MSISVDDVEALRSILSSLPRHQPKQVSKQEAIASLVIELAAAQRRGYSADDLARLMSEKGIDINGPTLRNCLRRLRKKRRARDKTTLRAVTAGSGPTSSPTASSDKRASTNLSADAAKPSASPLARESFTAKPEPRPLPSSDDRLTQK